MLVGISSGACGSSVQPTWTWSPAVVPSGGSAGTPSPTGPAGTASPTHGGLRPDPNAPFIYPRDARAPARLSGANHDIDLRVEERFNTVAEGFVREVWTFGGKVPGPVIRVGIGDSIRVHLVNHPPKLPGRANWMHPAVNDLPHSIDLLMPTSASTNGVGSIKPGEVRTYEFRADHPGVWLYRCGTEPLLQHVASGTFGMVIVEPEGGFAPVDQELFLVQSEWYLGGPQQPASLAKASALIPVPDFVVLNGIAGQYVLHPIPVEAGKRIRLFILDAGPNLESAFRIEGTTFDSVMMEGVDLADAAQGTLAGQAVQLAPGKGAIVEFTLAADGLYPIINEAFSVDGSSILGLFRAGG